MKPPTTAVANFSNQFLPQVVLAVTTLLSSWLLMQVVHEFGHVMAAVLTGGSVRDVVLVPWELSRTDLGNNPDPLLVCWMGPIIGALVPFTLWLCCRPLKFPFLYWLRFWAGFCLIANGAYIGFGAFTADGDAGDLMRAGCPKPFLILFGILTTPLGFALWHQLGTQFGFGTNASVIGWDKPLVVTSLLVVTVAVEVTIWIVKDGSFL